MPEPQPTFTLENEEQTWRVQMKQGEKDYLVYLTRYGNGKVTIKSFPTRTNLFNFVSSNPDTILAIGRLLVAAARKAGAIDE